MMRFNRFLVVALAVSVHLGFPNSYELPGESDVSSEVGDKLLFPLDPSPRPFYSIVPKFYPGPGNMKIR